MNTKRPLGEITSLINGSEYEAIVGPGKIPVKPGENFELVISTNKNAYDENSGELPGQYKYIRFILKKR